MGLNLDSEEKGSMDWKTEKLFVPQVVKGGIDPWTWNGQPKPFWYEKALEIRRPNISDAEIQDFIDSISWETKQVGVRMKNQTKGKPISDRVNDVDDNGNFISSDVETVVIPNQVKKGKKKMAKSKPSDKTIAALKAGQKKFNEDRRAGKINVTKIKQEKLSKEIDLLATYEKRIAELKASIARRQSRTTYSQIKNMWKKLNDTQRDELLSYIEEKYIIA